MVGVAGQQQQLFVVLDLRLEGTLDSAQLVVEAHPLLLRVFAFMFVLVLVVGAGVCVEVRTRVRVRVRIRVRVCVRVFGRVRVRVRAKLMFDLAVSSGTRTFPINQLYTEPTKFQRKKVVQRCGVTPARCMKGNLVWTTERSSI